MIDQQDAYTQELMKQVVMQIYDEYDEPDQNILTKHKKEIRSLIKI